MTNPICSKVSMFADGELSDEDCEEMRLHLPGCESCQKMLTFAMQMTARIQELFGSNPHKFDGLKGDEWYDNACKLCGLDAHNSIHRIN